MKKLLFLVTFFLLLSACSPTPTLVASSPVANPSVQDTNVASPIPQSETLAVTVEPTPTLASTTEPTGSISFQVLAPLDEAVVNVPQVEVVGIARVDAVVTVNDEIILVGDDQEFKATITLDEGPNLIEIIASDINGNESSLFLTVTYEP